MLVPFKGVTVEGALGIQHLNTDPGQDEASARHNVCLTPLTPKVEPLGLPNFLDFLDLPGSNPKKIHPCWLVS